MAGLGKNILITCAAIGVFSDAYFTQTPFAGLFAEEIAIPVSIANSIDQALTNGSDSLPRCYRLYICVDDPLWELQAIYGGDMQPEWWLSPTSQFYQNPYGSHLGNGIVQGLFPIFPELQYDSWFTIQADNSTDPGNVMSFQATPSQFLNWEVAGSAFSSGVTTGAAVTNVASYPSISGMPDAQNRILIAQITTDGDFSGSFNFQFRKMNPNGSIYSPITIVNIESVVFNSSTISSSPCLILLEENDNFLETSLSGNQISLDWHFHSVRGIESFQMQHSYDLMHWETIADMPDPTITTEHFTYSETRPYGSTNYYRVLILEEDSEMSYSEYLSVEIPANATPSIYPNPLSGNILFYNFPPEEIIRIDLSDAHGSLIERFTYPAINQLQIDPELNNGVYFVNSFLKSGKTAISRLVVLR